MANFVISYDAGETLPFGVARFSNIEGGINRFATYRNPFTYFATHAEALAEIVSKNGVVICDDFADAA